MTDASVNYGWLGVGRWRLLPLHSHNELRFIELFVSDAGNQRDGLPGASRLNRRGVVRGEAVEFLERAAAGVRLILLADLLRSRRAHWG